MKLSRLLSTRNVVAIIFSILITLAVHLALNFTQLEGPDRHHNSVVRIEVDWALVERDSVGKIIATKPQAPNKGTAFVISEQGHALTAAHVVYGWDYSRGRPYTADEVEIKSISIFRETTYSSDPARRAVPLNGGAPNSILNERDVSLLKIEGGGPWEPFCLSWAKPPDKGAPLVALGYPARRNSLSFSNGTMKNQNGDDGNWETDLTIERGDSGAPVIDPSGRVVGIARAGYGGTSAKSIIPADRYRGLVAEQQSRKCEGAAVPRNLPIAGILGANLPAVIMEQPTLAFAFSLTSSVITSYLAAWLALAFGSKVVSNMSGSKPKPVVVIGSVMVDVVARVDSDAQRRDRIGTITSFAVGGCAYNMFYSLTSEQIPAKLVTAINDSSPFKTWLVEKIRDISKQSYEVKFVEGGPEAIFIAQRFGKKIIQAVSSTTIDKFTFTPEWVNRLLSGVKIIAIDLSLTSEQIDMLLVEAARNNAEVVCNGTSDDRIVRLKNLTKGRVTSLICSEDEFIALTGMSWETAISMTSSDICHAAFCERLIVTRSEHGFSVFDPLLDNGRPRNFPAGTDQRAIRSTMGAGDALTACFAAARYQDINRGMKFSFDSFHNVVKAKLPSILGVEYSTPGAES